MRKFLLILAAVVLIISLVACDNGGDTKAAPAVLLLGDLPGLEDIAFGMHKEELETILDTPREESESGMLWYDLYGDYYGFEGSIGFKFSNKGKLNCVIYSFVNDLVGQIYGEESDLEVLYGSLKDGIVERTGSPATKSFDEEKWDLESYSVSLSKKNGVSVGVIQTFE